MLPNLDMRAAFVLLIILFVLSHAACKRPMTAMTAVHKGRQALIAGKAEAALAHFQRATELDPEFLYFSTLPQSAFTYTGRALYQLGRLSEARQTFEQAVLRFENDSMARLYFGITLARQGHRERGLQETTAGLKAIYEWLDYIEANLPQGIYWDSNREIRSEIERILKQMPERRLSAEQLIETAEWVGNRMEWELDAARRDEQMSRNRE
jgi:tetratricopeptide (TPR) repeat protein